MIEFLRIFEFKKGDDCSEDCYGIFRTLIVDDCDEDDCGECDDSEGK